jgi:hypothetical protein
MVTERWMVLIGDEQVFRWVMKEAFVFLCDGFD